MGSCIYGPVPSRRLGRSLGIDLLPAKICTYDCIYCQLGKTGGRTTKRRPYRNVAEVLAQLNSSFAQGLTADCITIAGSGEPTLNSDIGQEWRTIESHKCFLYHVCKCAFHAPEVVRAAKQDQQ